MPFLPRLAITAYSGTGKTTLLKKIIPLLQQQGIRLALIKHSHHDIDIDIPGKDSYELRKAGALQTVIASDKRWALMTETPKNKVNFDDIIKKLDNNITDLVLVEGFKDESMPKIALYRQAVTKPLDNLIDNYTIAVACDHPLALTLPFLDINDPQSVAQFIIDWLKDNKQFN